MFTYKPSAHVTPNNLFHKFLIAFILKYGKGPVIATITRRFQVGKLAMTYFDNIDQVIVKFENRYLYNKFIPSSLRE